MGILETMDAKLDLILAKLDAKPQTTEEKTKPKPIGGGGSGPQPPKTE